MPRSSSKRVVLRRKRSRDAAEADTPRTQRRPGSRLVSKDVAAAAKTLDFEDFDDSPPPAGAPRGRGSPAGTPPTRRTAVRSPPSAGARSTSSSGTAAPSGRTSSRSQASATAVSLSLAGGRGRKAPTARRSAIALPRLDPEGDDAGSADLDEGVLDVGSSAASAKRPRMSGPSEKAIPPRTDGRSWPRGVAPTAEEASADATSSVRDVFATADALTAAFQAALPRVNGLAMQNLEAVSTKAEEGSTSVIKAHVPGTRATFLALFRRFVTATAATHAPVKPTGFGIFARADSAGRTVPLEEAARRWAVLTASQRRVYEERARAEHAQAATELCRKMDAKGLVGEIDLSASALQGSSTLSAFSARHVLGRRAAPRGSEVRGDSTPLRKGASSSSSARRVVRPESSSVLSLRRVELMRVFKGEFTTNRSLFTALTVGGHSTLFATLQPRLTVAFTPSSADLGSDGEEHGTITLSARASFRWGEPASEALDSFKVAHGGSSSAHGSSPRPRGKSASPAARPSSARAAGRAASKAPAGRRSASRGGKAAPSASQGASMAAMAASLGLASLEY
ncbi:hypothetical protein FNF29_01761 [Cafeteria roenbergensis]|uniref:Uncharacterized protein n=1 Tax=Cafeteria roenbergensis TaxID=33653 RepID=A0A5A8CQR0_CAFRO|nr:hypothetical protein FNF29_01761 [Cafeteria roenbergensis]|eukprot:KAA0155386.1 hypothetical protein FNF29_01761 [Cafeteria roenbergensis]